ncbi:unnamed protein product [Euphydryas editha]|uniref:Fatty acyl-CoA reductase n=1 Tax=Euphydryas editha TaxID=104508 RepID=A0AAU9URR5_EUPED|nr:unnamed protein product [Euphydryas editha]
MRDIEEINEDARKENEAIKKAIVSGDSDVLKFYDNAVVFLTGGSGFIGKQLIEKLIRTCNIRKIYILLRVKKNKTVKERLKAILDDPVYDELHKEQPNFIDKLVPIKGDTEALKLGIDEANWKILTEEVNVIFHAAATINFREAIKIATLTNVRGAREILNLAKTCKHIKNKHKVSKTSDTDLYALTPADVRQIIREELHIIFNAFQSKIETQLGNKISEISSQLTQVTESITFMEKEYEEVRRDMQQKIEVINQLESENKNLRSYIQDMDSRLSQMERNSRASNIEIQGVPEHRNENLVTAVKQLAHTIKYNLTESDIHLCTRVSKIQKNSNRPRSIIVKFSCPRVRDGFLAAAIAYNKRNSNDKLNTSHIGMGGEHKPMYVTDHLSPSMKALHAAARVKAKELKYKYVWVKGGHVYMRKSDTSDYKFIKNMDTLNSLN